MNISLEKKKNDTLVSSEVLSHLLSNTYVLYVKTQNFHWNVTGPRFHQLHIFFEEQYQALATSIDDIAERVRMLGQKPPSTMSEFLHISTINESPDFYSENEMLKILEADHQHLVQSIKNWIREVQQVNDEGTVDLLIERLRYHDKVAWMIRSHIE